MDKLSKYRQRFRKLKYYISNGTQSLLPSIIFQLKLKAKLSNINIFNENYIIERVNYYNKINKIISIDRNYLFEKEFNSAKKGNVGSISQKISDFKLTKLHKHTYYYDLNKYLNYFNTNLRISYLFGDITHIPVIPAILKSRPISDDNNNSILFKLNKIRHFNFIKDRRNFENKLDKLVWRGVAHRQHRIDVMKQFYNNKLCDVGQINKNTGETVPWQKDFMGIYNQLKYKFVLCIEGNDVATNLKWVMSSNSIAMMVKPKFETWFMEGKLIPNYHYVLLKDDYSDLEEKVEYYSSPENLPEALNIINNAHAFIDQFKDKKREDLISLLVLKKYFEKSGQIKY